MAIHSSTTAWKIPWREEPDRLQSTGLAQRVGHNSVTSFSLVTQLKKKKKGDSRMVLAFTSNLNRVSGALVFTHRKRARGGGGGSTGL